MTQKNTLTGPVRNKGHGKVTAIIESLAFAGQRPGSFVKVVSDSMLNFYEQNSENDGAFPYSANSRNVPNASNPFNSLIYLKAILSSRATAAGARVASSPHRQSSSHQPAEIEDQKPK
jgi:hypothetical protein